MPKDEQSGYIIEFIQHGKQTKATAIDPRSGLEVSTIVPTTLPRPEMMRLAVQKLEYVMKRNDSA